MPLCDLLRVDSTVIDEVEVSSDWLEIRVLLLIVLRCLKVSLYAVLQGIRIRSQPILIATLDYNVITRRGRVILAGWESHEPLRLVRIIPCVVCLNGNDQVADYELIWLTFVILLPVSLALDLEQSAAFLL